jgi:hydrogenase expression/formation protein HypE
MNFSKLSPKQLEQNVLQYVTKTRGEVLVSGSLGEDCAVIKPKKYVLLSSDPITGASKNIGFLAINVSVNDIAACGVEPIAAMLTVIAPPCATEQTINDIMREANAAARELNIDIIGGHTEFSDAVNRTVVSATIIGHTDEKYFLTKDAKAGDDIIVTKYIGLEGTSIIGEDYGALLKLSAAELKQAKDTIKQISVLKEGLLCAGLNISSMHDITEGGVFGAVAELACGAGLGAEVYTEKIPVLQITRKICAQLSLDPFRLLSSGSMLITAPKGEGAKIVGALSAAGIKGTVIGKITPKDVVAVYPDCRKIIKAMPDELLKLSAAK